MNLSFNSNSPSQSGLQRKLLWLLILATLWAVTLLIIPRVSTQRPAIDSKLLTLRVMLCAISLAVMFGWKAFQAARWRFPDTVYLCLFGAFSAATVFSSNVMYSLAESWQFGGLLLLSWVIFRFSPSPAECKGLLWTVGALGLIASLYGFLTYIGADILRPLYPFDFEENQAGGRNYIHSFFGNPEYFGGFAAPTAVVLWGLAFQPPLKLRWRMLFAAATAFVLLILGLSGSRGAFLGFLAGATIVFIGQVSFLAPHMKKAAWLMLGSGVLALGIAVTILSVPNPLNPRDMRLASRFTDLVNTQTASVRERALFYTSTAAAIPANPIFGYGPGTYRLEFLNNVKRLVEQDPRAGTTAMLQELDRRLAEHAHNDYLEIWFEQGTFGLGSFLLLIAYGSVCFVCRRVGIGWRTTTSHDANVTVGHYVTTFAAVVTICINALTSFPMHMPARASLLWVLIGAFFAMDKQLSEAPVSGAGITTDNLSRTKDEN